MEGSSSSVPSNKELKNPFANSVNSLYLLDQMLDKWSGFHFVKNSMTSESKIWALSSSEIVRSSESPADEFEVEFDDVGDWDVFGNVDKRHLLRDGECGTVSYD